ncbi:MAG: carboxymuconolactone decarboxylase family protein [Rhodospirillaceae bacterium]|jgi:4-carboxymuconolactone decarboxylase
MSRLETLTPETMTEEQRKVHDDIVAGPRGKMTLPMNAWLRSPPFADGAQNLGAFIRWGSTLDARHVELAILIMLRYWTAQPAWYSHVQHGLKAGLELEIIDAIKEIKRPDFKRSDDEALFDFCVSLILDHEVPDEAYDAAVKEFGERGVMEIIGVIGYYCITSMTLKAFRVPMQEGVEPQLKD